jgi:hypothetical protein
LCKYDQCVKPADRFFSLKVGDVPFAAAEAEPIDYMQFRFKVASGEPNIADGEPLLETLDELTELVDGIVSRFEPYLT